MDLNFNSRQHESLFIRKCFIFQAVLVKPRVTKSRNPFPGSWSLFLWDALPKFLAPPQSTCQALAVELEYLDKADSLWDKKRDFLASNSQGAAPAFPMGRGFVPVISRKGFTPFSASCGCTKGISGVTWCSKSLGFIESYSELSVLFCGAGREHRAGQAKQPRVKSRHSWGRV